MLSSYTFILWSWTLIKFPAVTDKPNWANSDHDKPLPFEFFSRGDAVNGKQPSSANTSNKQRSAKDPFWFLMLISTKTARKISAVEKSGSLWATVGWVKSRIINKIQQSCASYMSWTLTVQNLWEPLEVILSLSSAALWCPLHCILGYCDATVWTAFKTDPPYFAFLLRILLKQDTALLSHVC